MDRSRKFLKIVEGGEIDDEWGEYTISLLHFKHSTDLIIWGNSGVDYQKDFDPFWILFDVSNKPEAEKMFDELTGFFKRNKKQQYF